MQEAVAAFLSEAAARLQALGPLAGCHDRISLRREAHSLKGMAAQFGFLRLSRAAAELEAASDTISPEAAAAATARLGEIYAQSQGHRPGAVAQAA